MAAFCGRCGARVLRPDQSFCTRCGARLPPSAGRRPRPGQPGGSPAELEEIADRPTGERARAPVPPGPDPLQPAATAPSRPVRAVVLPWEVAVLAIVAAAWVVYTLWRVAPALVDLARGESLGGGRLIETVTTIAIPPLAIAAFFAARLTGRGGWRWALPLLITVPLVSFGIANDADRPPADGPASAARSGPARKSDGTPTAPVRPGPTPTAGAAESGPGGLPLPIPVPSLPIPVPSLPIPLPGADPTPVVSARLTADQARDRVRESLARCRILRREIDLAQVTFEPPDWLVSLPLSGATWRVNDATGAVTPDARAAEREKDCL